MGAELRQGRPWLSVAQEATIALLRTASVVGRALERVTEAYGLSLAQYNALRIVRGAGSGGIPTLAIRERMIEQGTTITRLLDKLDAAGLVRRERAPADRRQVICYATGAGLRLLAEMDPVVDAADEAVMEGLTAEQLEPFVETLDAIRRINAVRGAPAHEAQAP